LLSCRPKAIGFGLPLVSVGGDRGGVGVRGERVWVGFWDLLIWGWRARVVLGWLVDVVGFDLENEHARAFIRVAVSHWLPSIVCALRLATSYVWITSLTLRVERSYVNYHMRYAYGNMMIFDLFKSVGGLLINTVAAADSVHS